MLADVACQNVRNRDSDETIGRMPHGMGCCPYVLLALQNLRSDQSETNRAAYEMCCRLHREFFANVLAMMFDRLCRDPQDRCDLLHGLAVRDEPEDVVLA